jgi:hypothetical protein
MSARLDVNLEGLGQAAVPPLVNWVLDEERRRVASFILSHVRQSEDVGNIGPGRYSLETVLPSGEGYATGFLVDREGAQVSVRLGLDGDTPDLIQTGLLLGVLPRVPEPAKPALSDVRFKYQVWQRSSEEDPWRRARIEELHSFPTFRDYQFSILRPEPACWTVVATWVSDAARAEFFALPPSVSEGPRVGFALIGDTRAIRYTGEAASAVVPLALDGGHEAQAMLRYLLSGNLRAADALLPYLVERNSQSRRPGNPDSALALAYYCFIRERFDILARHADVIMKVAAEVPDIFVILAAMHLSSLDDPNPETAMHLVLQGLRLGVPIYRHGVRAALKAVHRLLAIRNDLPSYEEDRFEELVERGRKLERYAGAMTGHDVFARFFGDGPDSPSPEYAQHLRQLDYATAAETSDVSRTGPMNPMVV